MNFVAGSVVRSKAGHDKGSFYAVLSVDEDMALIADGYDRPVSRPKRKKLIHLAFTRTVLSEQILNDDSKLSEALAPFNEGVRAFRGGNSIV